MIGEAPRHRCSGDETARVQRSRHRVAVEGREREAAVHRNARAISLRTKWSGAGDERRATDERSVRMTDTYLVESGRSDE